MDSSRARTDGFGSTPSSWSSASRSRLNAQRLGLAPFAVQREHEPLGQALAERVRRDHPGQQIADVARAVEHEVGVGEQLDGGEPLLLELHRLVSQRLQVLQVAVGRPATQGQGPLQRADGLHRRPGGRRRPRPAERGFERERVDRLGRDRDLIAARGRLDRSEIGVGAATQRLAEKREVHPEGTLRRGRRFVHPQLVDQLIGRDGVIRPGQEQREEPPALGPRDRHVASLSPDPKRPQD